MYASSRTKMMTVVAMMSMMGTATPTVIPTTDPPLFTGTAGEGGSPVDAIATDPRRSQFGRSIAVLDFEQNYSCDADAACLYVRRGQ